MVNFIICDDNLEILNKVSSIVDEEMMKNQIAYTKHTFNDYDSDFIKIVESKLPCKIYILDIETPTYSGIDIARMIRDTDMESVIMFLTSHDELGYLVLKGEFLFLSFINKYNDYQEKLKKSICKALDILDKKRIIRFEDRGAVYTIPIKDILYITRDNIERKVIINTEHTKYSVNKTLVEMLDMLNSSFKQSHRSCIVNKKRIAIVNVSKRRITFDTGTEIDWLSLKYKNEVI
ncbi:MAG: LytTR family DNA-binding domain-containing protein [Bacilli bacterium]|nr:LytTR family DNA-binding domain-containing protein [Bacilli bacterium]MDD4282215.1 LytTR family DNA-binding domain-containing protein [Bacilli bacterium]MDD4718214.1 LytTR family DNA-binding domain-containing protein [Bacilli bacterium]